MTADAHPGDGGGTSPFDVVDSKLTIYALANGMDLEKAAASRRLGWYREKLDRGVLIEVTGAGTFDVHALAWKTGDADSERRAPVAQGIRADELPGRLSELLEAGMEAANGL